MNQTGVMILASVLLSVLEEGATELHFVEHSEDLRLGPFLFPAAVPLPLPTAGNELARTPWLRIPFRERETISPQLEVEGEVEEAADEELVRALAGGHLPAGSPDHVRLVDQVGRSLLQHSVLHTDEPWQGEHEEVFARADEGRLLFEHLIQTARLHLQEASAHAEARRADHALLEFLVARLLYGGAALLSPTTPGIRYDTGVLLHELAHRFAFGSESEKEAWRSRLSRESLHNLMLAMSDEEIREQTPARYLSGISRETLERAEEAEQDYAAFLASPAAERYTVLAEEVRQRLTALREGGMADERA